MEAKQYKRPDMNEDLRLGFASITEMVTLDCSHLPGVLWGVRKGFQARLDEVEEWQAQRGAEEPIRNMADARRRTIKTVYEDPFST